MLFSLDRDFDFLFNGAAITCLVCIVSGLLFYLFKHAASGQSSVVIPTELVINKRRGKKQEVKKNKKSKKRSITNSGDPKPVDPVVGGLTNETDVDVMEEMIAQDEALASSESDRSTPESASTDSLENLISAPDAGEENFCSERVVEESDSNGGFLLLSDPAAEKISVEDSETVVTLQKSEPSPTTVEVKSTAKSKRNRRRNGKGGNKVTEDEKQPSPLVVESADVPTEAAPFITAKPDASVVKLEKQLQDSRQQLEQERKQASELTQENDQLRTANEQLSLGLQVVQQQYTELLRSNKVVEASLKSSQNESQMLLARLEQATAEQQQTRSELRTTKEQLAEVSAQLAAARVPSPELVRSQELTAQLGSLSNENCLLKARLEQFDSELGQLRQTNMRQQQELQAFRLENRTLRSEHEAALEEVRVQRQTEQSDASARLVNYEAQLQHRHHELEVEKQRSQEFARQLSDARSELQLSFEREKRQTEVIASLEYQFEEVRASEQRLRAERETEAANSARLKAQLECSQRELEQTRDELAEALHQLKPSSPPPQHEDEQEQLQRERDTALADAQRFKSALLETEALLGALQASAEQTETEWRRRLTESEHGRAQNEMKLQQALDTVQQLSARLEEFERRASPPIHERSVSHSVGPESSVEELLASGCDQPLTASEDAAASVIENVAEETKTAEVQQHQPGSAQDSDTDFDAVLVDNTDLHVADSIWDTGNSETDAVLAPAAGDELADA